MTILAGQDWSVKEVACRSTGDPHCEFVITPSA
jgi:predicted hydrocarbon binding protein